MMRSVFIDTAYWIAQFNSKDSLHVSAMELEKALVGAELLTSELVLVEFLNFFCKFGSVTRKEVSEFVQFLLPNAAIEIVWQTPDLFSAGNDSEKDNAFNDSVAADAADIGCGFNG